MLFPYLTYWWRRSRNPELADYVSEGLGIEFRARRARKFWARHLQLCKEFQRQAVATLNPEAKRIVVLGAGRLLDFEPEPFCKQGAEITLIDADPGAVRSWKKFQRTAAGKGAVVIPRQCELTGRILGWTGELKARFSQSGILTAEKITEILWRFPALAREEVLLPEADVILSLNLLSQIPIHWRERVLGLIRKFAPHVISADGKLPPALDTAIERTMSLLQIEHLELLRESRTKLVVLISDVEFYFYKKEIAPWQVDPALFECPVESLLPGVVKMRDTWLWHLAPQGIEEPDYGAIHKVAAFASVLE